MKTINNTPKAPFFTLGAFEFSRFYSKFWFYIALVATLLFGILIGSGASFSLSIYIFKNSPYTITLMSGFLSLFAIFFTTILCTQIIFKETDSNFHLIYYALPIRKFDLFGAKFLVVFFLSFLSISILEIGFAIGQTLPTDRSRYTDVSLSWYIQPLFVFGFINTFFCSAMLSSVAWLSKNKMLVYVSGLMLYIFYMVTLIFSGSPLMAKGMPQSAQMVLLSAIFDPFGISGFFYQTTNWTIDQRNTELVSPTHILLYNRLGTLVFSLLILVFTFQKFSFQTKEKRKKLKPQTIDNKPIVFKKLIILNPSKSWKRHLFALFSITKIDLKYTIKSIPFMVICLGFLFVLGMEMFGDIEKGIRLPQKFATSGLMASTIIDEFNLLCLLAIIFYANDIFWRSRTNNFTLIEAATPLKKSTFLFSKWLTLSVLIVIFTCLTIVLGIIFQVAYNHPYFDWYAYGGIFVFVSLRIIVVAGFVLIVQQLIPNKIISLVIASALIGLFATPFGNRILNHPALEFLMPFAGNYTDMNGYGTYFAYFCLRYAFGFGIVLVVLWLVLNARNWSRIKPITVFLLGVLLIITTFFGIQLSKSYQVRDRNFENEAKAKYEKQFRKFQQIPQPTITDIKSKVNLFPEKRSYQIEGQYIIQNKTNQVIDSVLVNFADNFQIIEANFAGISVKNQIEVIKLKKPLLPNETTVMNFKIAYSWATVNGHQSFNAIVENGSFMRISRYFPQIGYVSDNEIEQKDERNKYQLGEQTAIKKLEEPKVSANDFINLDMTISTNASQTAIGVGELEKQWKQQDRNFFRYKTTSPIPFRFAISSANYVIKKESYKGKSIEIYYHETHHQNVKHLLENIKVTLDYCQTNFGEYPFKTIRFAEVSGFTKGFAATAYPASIFMTENMVFDANIKADKGQDVINELAGHELSHLWWGGNQINPDEREGVAMLTETLAMYTELMVSKRMYGQKRVLENVDLYQRMYFDERGFTEEQPLNRALSENVHLSYYKGLVAMYQLTELIGEEKVNIALKNFLQKHKYPNQKPITTDLLSVFYEVTNATVYPKIDELFKQTVIYDLNIKKAELQKNKDTNFTIDIEAEGLKITENTSKKRLKIPLSEEIEVGIYFEKTEPIFRKLACIKGKIKAKIDLSSQPTKIILDPNLLFLNQNRDGAVRVF